MNDDEKKRAELVIFCVAAIAHSIALTIRGGTVEAQIGGRAAALADQIVAQARRRFPKAPA